MDAFNREEFLQSFMEGKGKKSVFWTLVFGLFALLFFGLLIATFMNSSSSVGGLIVVTLIFGGLGAFFLWLFISGFKKYNPEKDENLQDLKRGGNHIVWVYPYMQTVNGFSSHWVKYMTQEGKVVSLTTVKEDRQREVIYGISKLYPNAVVGYSPEIEKNMQSRYKR